MKNFRHKRLTRLALCWLKALRWTAYYNKYSGAFLKGYHVDTSRAWIMRQAHTVEKGLALPAPRPFFGKAKISQLKEHMEKSANDPKNADATQIGYGVLSCYVQWNREQGVKDAAIDDLSADVEKHGGLVQNGGVIPYALTYSDAEREAFDHILRNRRSVRNFSDEIVPEATLREAIDVANYSPSVCNRQPWAAAIIQTPDAVQRLLRLQSGNKGFDQTIHNLIVVLADTRAFVEEYEVFEPYVDAGIFSGALVNALAIRNIGSCCLNLCVSHKKAMEINKALKLAPHFYPVMMIAVGHVAEGAGVAMSKRLSPQVFSL